MGFISTILFYVGGGAVLLAFLLLIDKIRGKNFDGFRFCQFLISGTIICLFAYLNHLEDEDIYKSGLRNGYYRNFIMEVETHVKYEPLINGVDTIVYEVTDTLFLPPKKK